MILHNVIVNVLWFISKNNEVLRNIKTSLQHSAITFLLDVAEKPSFFCGQISKRHISEVCSIF